MGSDIMCMNFFVAKSNHMSEARHEKTTNANWPPGRQRIKSKQEVITQFKVTIRNSFSSRRTPTGRGTIPNLAVFAHPPKM